MAKFDDIIARIDDADLKSELETAFLDSLESRDAKIKSLETHNTELDSKVKDYAVANFDLMRKTDVSKDHKDVKTEDKTKLMSLSELAKGIRGE